MREHGSSAVADSVLPFTIRSGREMIANPWCLWLIAGALLPVAQAFDTRRLLLVAVLSLLVSVAVFRRRFLTPPSGVAHAGIAIVCLGLLSSFASAAPRWGLLGVAYAALCVLAAAALGHRLQTAASVDYSRLVALAFVVPVALTCYAVCATIYSSAVSGIPLVYPEPLRDFANIRFFNQYQTWTLPFLAAAMALPCPTPRVRAWLWKAMLVVVATFFLALYWRSAGRGTGYSTLLASLIVALVAGPAGRAHATRMALIAVAGYGVSLVMFNLGTATNAHVLSTHLAGRWALWRIALTESMQHPWLGLGPMLFAGLDNGIASHPHNAVIQWAMEWGLPAALLFAAIVGWLLFLSLRSARRRLARPDDIPPPVLVAVAASLLAGATHALVSGVIVMPASQFMLVTVAALAAALFAERRSERQPRRFGRSSAPLVYAAATLSVAYVAAFTVYDYASRVRHAPPQTAVYTRNAFQPRYWADGTLAPIVQPETSTLGH